MYSCYDLRPLYGVPYCSALAILCTVSTVQKCCALYSSSVNWVDTYHRPNRHSRAMTVDDPVVEDDWSSLIKDSSLNSFAEHVLEVLELPDGQLIQLRCVKALTPLGMINLYNTAHDATGNRIWMGALFFEDR